MQSDVTCFGCCTLLLVAWFTFHEAFSLVSINPVWTVDTHTFVLGLPLIPCLDYPQTHLACANGQGVYEQCPVGSC